MKNFIIITTLCFLLTGTYYSQIKFEISYNSGRSDRARAIVQTFDMGYAVVGTSENHDKNTDAYLLKIDELGNYLWAKRYGQSGIDWAQDVIETPDSGLAILGYGENHGSYDMYFIKVNKLGDTLYTRYIGGSDWDFGYSLQLTKDSGFILAGETYQAGVSKAYLVKLNSKGIKEWDSVYGGNVKNKFESITITSNGDYVMAGETESFGNGRQAYVVRTDSVGTLLWQKSFGNPGIDFAKGIVELNSGELIFSGGTNTPPYADLDSWSVKLSSTGNFLQDVVVYDYSTSPPIVHNDDFNEGVIKYNDSVVFFGNRTYDQNPGNVYYYRYSSNLSPAGYQSYFHKYIINFQSAFDAKMTKDKGIIFACTAEHIDDSRASIYLIKIDSTLSSPHPFFNSISYQTDISSVEELEESIDFSIYPNPTQNYSYLNLEEFNNQKVVITIFDTYGNLIESKSSTKSKEEINLASYKTGIYIIRVSSNGEIINKKIIVSK